MTVGGTVVERLVQACISSNDRVILVVGVDPHGVVVAVFLAARAEVGKAGTAITRYLNEDVHLVDDVGIMGGRLDFLVVVWAGAAGDVLVATFPALALVHRSVETTLGVVGFDGGVDQLGVGWSNRETDLSHVAAGETHIHAPPGIAAVGGFVDARLRAAGKERPGVPPPLVSRGIHHVRVRRVELHVGDAGVLIDFQHLNPGRAAVGGFVEPTMTTRRPQRALRGNEHNVAVARVHENLADVFGSLESHLLPGSSTISAAVDAVTPPNVSPAHVLAGADPHDLRIRRIEGNVTDRVRGSIVEDRRPCDAGIRSLPEPAGPDGHVPRAALCRVHGDVGDAAAHDGRADGAEFEGGGDLRQLLGALSGQALSQANQHEDGHEGHTCGADRHEVIPVSSVCGCGSCFGEDCISRAGFERGNGYCVTSRSPIAPID